MRAGGAGSPNLVLPDHAPVRLDVFVHHAVDAEAYLHVGADSGAVERQYATKSCNKGVLALEDAACPSWNDDLAHRSAVERGHRRAAGTCLDEHQAEGFWFLHRVQQGRGPTEERHLGGLVHLAGKDHPRPVHERLHMRVEVVVLGSREDEAHAGPPGNVDGLQHALAGREAPKEEQVVVRRSTEGEVGWLDRVVHGGDHVQALHAAGLLM